MSNQGHQLKIENRKITELVPYEKNPRKNDHAVEAVVKAIDTYGFNVPVLIKSDGTIIDGHLRYKAALYLGLQDVPTIVADHLSENEIKAFRISVNKVAELAKWDTALLEQELMALADVDFDISTIGFSEADIDVMIGGKLAKENADNCPEIKPPLVSLGELWILGEHKLFIGDSTKRDSYLQLLAGERVDLCWTDPPYNVDYSGKAGKIENDKMSEEEFFTFLHGFYCCAHEFMKEGGPIYVAHADGHPSAAFRQMFLKAGFYYSTCLIWAKSQATIGRSDYHFKHEPILYGWKPGAAHCWYGGRKRKSVIELSREELFREENGEVVFTLGNEEIVVSGENLSVRSYLPTVMVFDKPLKSELHPTMKPVALVEHCVINSSKKHEVVLDCFGGSGTTLIACENMGRKARLIEMDPKFADVIIRRWQEYTGKDARLQSGLAYKDLQGLH